MHVAFQLSRLLPVLRYVVHVFIYNCSVLQVSMDTAHFGTDCCGNENASRESINERRDVTTCRPPSSLNADPSLPPTTNMSSLLPASQKPNSEPWHSIEDRSEQQQVRGGGLSTLTSVSTGVWMGLLFDSLSMRTCSKSS